MVPRAKKTKKVSKKELPKKANKLKPKLQKTNLLNIIERILLFSIGIIILSQLLGLQIFPFPYKLLSQSIGFVILLIAASISISGRKQLDTNWTAASDFQIKKDHTLINKGIYKYIRHPIYTGMGLMFLAVELIAQSYLYLLFFPTFIQLYFWAKREELLLLKHFGKKYADYLKSSKMFFPFIFYII